VHELTVAILHAEGEEEGRQCRRRLFAYLEGLEAKYGSLPSIVATRADFSEDPHESERLLRRAYELAEMRGDARNELYVSHSLAKLYVQDLRDPASARSWLETLRRHLLQVEDSYLLEDYWHLRRELEELGGI
jgi:hypothetical protein